MAGGVEVGETAEFLEAPRAEHEAGEVDPKGLRLRPEKVEDETGRRGDFGRWRVELDLLAVHALTRVELHWGPYDWSINYDLQTSPDGQQWTTVHHETNNTDGGVDSIDLAEANGRYLRLLCAGPKSDNWSYEVYELQVFGSP